ncbi:MAG TPA: hypothetical protein DCG78_00505 [Anaerolineaceae bacterium]|nr:hypothetical protein [Anaerolineaceae bacterium]
MKTYRPRGDQEAMRDKRRATMDTVTLVMVGLAIALLIYALIRGGGLAKDGVKLAGKTLWNTLPLLLAGFLIGGLVQVLLPPELIQTWLGEEAGLKGILIGCLAGGLIPGSPYVIFPIVGGLYKAGAGVGAVVGFVSAWSLWSVSRFPMEIALIDTKVAVLRYAITFLVPPLAGLLANSLARVVG